MNPAQAFVVQLDTDSPEEGCRQKKFHSLRDLVKVEYVHTERFLPKNIEHFCFTCNQIEAPFAYSSNKCSFQLSVTIVWDSSGNLAQAFIDRKHIFLSCECS